MVSFADPSPDAPLLAVSRLCYVIETLPYMFGLRIIVTIHKITIVSR